MNRIKGTRDKSRYSIAAVGTPAPTPTAAVPHSSAAAPVGGGRSAARSVDAPGAQGLAYPFEKPPALGAVLEVAPGVLWLRMPLPFALDHINLWLLRDGDGWTQIDCGYGDQPTRALWQAHLATTFAGLPLRRIVVTHYHPDHLGNAEWLRRQFDCELTMPLAEFLTAHAISGEHSGYGVEPTATLFRRHGMAPADVADLKARGNLYRRGVPELPLACRRLIGGDEIPIGGQRWRAIAGYGHSPEHAALHCRELGVLVSGDMLLPRISTNVSVWPVDPDGDPVSSFLASLEAFRNLPGETLVLPSHGLPFIGIGARVAALHAHHAERLDDLAAAASVPVCAAEILPILFRRPLDLQQRFFAMGEAIAHLNCLWQQDRLARSEGADGALRFVRTPSR